LLIETGARQITPKGESAHLIRTEWLTTFSVIFSPSINKTAKNPSEWGEHGVGTHLAKRVTTKGVVMKKGLVSIFCLLVLTFTAIPAGAQTRYRRFDGRRYDQRFDNYRYRQQVYSGQRDRRWDRDRSFWDKHRDKLTTGIGAGAGAAVGAMVGGKKGALIGALLGGGGAAIYTYGIRDKERRRRY
jgi:hypothetical protein